MLPKYRETEELPRDGYDTAAPDDIAELVRDGWRVELVQWAGPEKPGVVLCALLSRKR